MVSVNWIPKSFEHHWGAHGAICLVNRLFIRSVASVPIPPVVKFKIVGKILDTIRDVHVCESDTRQEGIENGKYVRRDLV